MNVFRGINLPDDKLAAFDKRYSKGRTVADKGFLSTSRDEAVGANFARVMYQQSPQAAIEASKQGFGLGGQSRSAIMFEIHTPKGTKALVTNFTESEVIFAPETNLRIKEVKTGVIHKIPDELNPDDDAMALYGYVDRYIIMEIEE